MNSRDLLLFHIWSRMNNRDFFIIPDIKQNEQQGIVIIPCMTQNKQQKNLLFLICSIFTIFQILHFSNTVQKINFFIFLIKVAGCSCFCVFSLFWFTVFFYLLVSCFIHVFPFIDSFHGSSSTPCVLSSMQLRELIFFSSFLFKKVLGGEGEELWLYTVPLQWDKIFIFGI